MGDWWAETDEMVHGHEDAGSRYDRIDGPAEWDLPYRKPGDDLMDRLIRRSNPFSRGWRDGDDGGDPPDPVSECACCHRSGPCAEWGDGWDDVPDQGGPVFDGRPRTPRRLTDLAGEQAHLLAISWDDRERGPDLAAETRAVRRSVIPAGKRLGVG